MRTTIKLVLIWLLALVGTAQAATSYTNPLGSGPRTQYITATASSGLMVNGPVGLVDGSYANGRWFNGVAVSGHYIRFDFGSGNQFPIDEAIYYQNNTSSHGTWKWQGSDNASDWTDVGGGFTFGGVATQTQTSLNGNTTAYRYYQLLGVSGNASGSPDAQEFEFKIGDVVTTGASYVRRYGTGVRTAAMSATTDLTLAGGTFQTLVDGYSASGLLFNAQAVAGKYIKFDFTESMIVTESYFHQMATVSNPHGVWRWQGSADNSSWTTIGADFNLGDTTADQLLTTLSGNTTAYRYYRLLGVSGNSSNVPWIYEFEFKTDFPAAPTSSIKSVSTVPLAGIGKPAGVAIADVGKVAEVANQ